MSYLDEEIVPILNITPNLVFFSAAKNTDKIPLLAWTIIKKVIWVVRFLRKGEIDFCPKVYILGNQSNNAEI